MTPNPRPDGSPSILRDGRLKPGIYQIQNLYTRTYLDIHEHSREVCCRPAAALEEGAGLWEIRHLGAGYSVQRFDPGNPEQFCTPLNGINDGARLRVAAYPAAWRAEIVNDGNHRGFEYIRFYWGTEKIAWDLLAACKDDGAPVITHHETLNPWQIWKLTRIEGAFPPPHSPFGTTDEGPLPAYEGATGQPPTRAQHAEFERDEFGTVVTEVIVATTTTRKKYRVEDA